MNYEKYWYELTGYKITAEPLLMEDEAVADAIDRFSPIDHKASLRLVRQLEKAIQRFPEEPKLKNFLFVHNLSLGLKTKALKIAQKTIVDHPDYFYGKISLAQHYLDEGQPDSARLYFDPEASLESYFPDRTSYHYSEYLNYQYALAKFDLLENPDFRKANDISILLEKVLPDHPIARQLNYELMVRRLEIVKERQAANKKVEVIPQKGFEKRKEKPSFHHEIMEELYNYGSGDLPIPIKESILALPPETATADIRAVLADSAHRFQYFYNKYKEWQEAKLSFPIHALELLGAFKDTQALDLVLKLFREGDKYIEYWFAFDVQEYAVEPMYQIADRRFELMTAFWQEENVDPWGKICIQDVLLKYVDEDIRLLPQIRQYFQTYWAYCLEHKDNANLIDTLWLDSTLVAVRNLGGEDLLPLAKEMYAAGLFTDNMLGDWADIEEDYKVFGSLVAQYLEDENAQQNYVLSEYLKEHKPKIELPYEDDFFSESESEAEVPSYYDLIGQSESFEHQPAVSKWTTTQPIRTGPKVGRNEPCPCGSGKKHKKCCWNK